MFRTGIIKRAKDGLRRHQERRQDEAKRFVVAKGELNHRPNFRYGFFGELGYGLIGWLPYLKYVSQKIGPIKTVGLVGTSPFWEFSSDHIEVSVHQSDMWGDRTSAIQAAQFLDRSEHLVAPVTAEGYRAYDFSLNGHAWKSLELHRNLTGDNYAPLLLPQGSPEYTGFPTRPYVVINVKNYFNWGNTDIPNLYSADEIANIAAICEAKGFQVALNRFPASRESTNIYLEEDYLEGVLARGNVIDMLPRYAAIESTADRNRLQTDVIAGAEHVFASQGGNAVLALMGNKSVTVLMRGGYDYPDYTSLARIYGSKLDLIYELRQSMYLMR
jgi:hypothetical protein